MENMSKDSINLEDIVQVIVGSSALTIPVAFSEESWRLSETLPTLNIIIILILSLLFINIYSFEGIFQGQIKHRLSHFALRTIIDYGVTFVVVFIILFALNRMPIIEEPLIAFKRIILLSFPASMGGVIVDGFDKE
jgi:Predicted membrane protein